MSSVTLLSMAACITDEKMARIVADNPQADFDNDGYLALSKDEFLAITGTDVLPNDYYGFDDCDDTNEMIHPGAMEVGPDSFDDDCDGAIDEFFSTIFTGGDSQSLGKVVRSVSDQNGDGISELALGSQGYSEEARLTGAVSVFTTPIIYDAAMASNADLLIIGENSRDQVGIAIDGGAGKIALGVPNYDADGYSDSGAVYLVSELPSSTSVTLNADVSDGDFFLKRFTLGDFWGDEFINDEMNFGAFVLVTGDICPSGQLGPLIGAPNVDSMSVDSGLVMALCTDEELDVTSTTYLYSQAPDQFGSAGASGDFDADGHTDLLISAKGEGLDDQGAVYLISTNNIELEGTNFVNAGNLYTSSLILTGENENDALGDALAFGDVNADGYDDFITSAVNFGDANGTVYVVFGKFLDLDRTIENDIYSYADIIYNPPGGESWMVGTAVGLDDIDNDGMADVIIGAQNASVDDKECGAVFIDVDATAGLNEIEQSSDILLSSYEDGAGFGVSLDSSGDYNGDSFKDILVGASSENDSAGAAYLFYGGEF